MAVERQAVAVVAVVAAAAAAVAMVEKERRAVVVLRRTVGLERGAVAEALALTAKRICSGSRKMLAAVVGLEAARAGAALVHRCGLVPGGRRWRRS